MSSQQHRRPGRTTLATFIAAALLTSGAAAAAPGAVSADTGKARHAKQVAKAIGTPKAAGKKDKLGASDRAKLAEAKADGDRNVTAMIVTKPSATKQVARQITAAGGYIRMTDAKLGYVSAVVPTGKLDKTVLADTDVKAVDLDELLRLPQPEKKSPSTTTASGAYTGPNASTPDTNPYMPTKDTGSTAFKAQHKAWDGRGITIGILDSGIDLDSNPLRTTSTPGQEKVSDWFTATDPVTEGDFVTGGDPTWLPMVQAATGPRFPATGTTGYRGSVWTLPRYRQLQDPHRGRGQAQRRRLRALRRQPRRRLDRPHRRALRARPPTRSGSTPTTTSRSPTRRRWRRYKASRPDRPHRHGQARPRRSTRRSRSSSTTASTWTTTVLGLPADPYKDVTAVDIGIASGEHGSHVAGIAAAQLRSSAARWTARRLAPSSSPPAPATSASAAPPRL